MSTPKISNVPGSKPSKGFAFIEFTSTSALQAALKMHHSVLLNRKINIELSAGGGGNSAQRKSKITASNKKLSDQREKANAEKRKKDLKAKAARVEKSLALQADPSAVAEGLPVKVKPKKEAKKPWLISGANSIKLG